MNSETERYFLKIRESLKLLSLTFNEQKQFFPTFVDMPFEVLDTYEKAFLLLPQVVESKKISSYSVIANLLRIHFAINMIFNHPNYDEFDDEKLTTITDWNRVRELSIQTLQLMGVPLDKPNPDYT